MKNKTIGMILLCMAGLCTTLDLAATKLSNAFITGMVYLGGKGGSLPKNPAIEGEVLIIVAVLTIMGGVFLFKLDDSSNSQR